MIQKVYGQAMQVTVTSITYVGPAVSCTLYMYGVDAAGNTVLGSSGGVIDLPAVSTPTVIPVTPPLVVPVSLVSPTFRGQINGHIQALKTGDFTKIFGNIDSGPVYNIVDPVIDVTPGFSTVSGLAAAWT